MRYRFEVLPGRGTILKAFLRAALTFYPNRKASNLIANRLKAMLLLRRKERLFTYFCRTILKLAMRQRYDLKTEAKLAMLPTITMTFVLLLLEAYSKQHLLLATEK
jgi:hypothetical protein